MFDASMILDVTDHASTYQSTDRSIGARRRDRAKTGLAVASGASAALLVGGTGAVAALVAQHQDHVEQDRRAAKTRALAGQSPVAAVEAQPVVAVAPVVIQRPQRTVVDPAVVVAVSSPGAAAPGGSASSARATTTARNGTGSTTRSTNTRAVVTSAARTTLTRTVTKSAPRAAAPRPAPPPPAPSTGS